MLSSLYHFKGARNKRDIALKACWGRKKAAGFEKTESGLRYQFIQREKVAGKKQFPYWRIVRVGKVLTALIQEKQLNFH
jgi:hypothetical protein